METTLSAAAQYTPSAHRQVSIKLNSLLLLTSHDPTGCPVTRHVPVTPDMMKTTITKVGDFVEANGGIVLRQYEGRNVCMLLSGPADLATRLQADTELAPRVEVFNA